MKSAHQKRVEEFMLAAEQEVPAKVTIPSKEVVMLRARLILEEALETIHALGVRVYLNHGTASINNVSPIQNFSQLCFVDEAPPNIVEVADGCADLSVVTTGTLSAFGISDVAILEEVDRNNLEKIAAGTKDPITGKWIKPPGFPKPNIAACLLDQGYDFR